MNHLEIFSIQRSEPPRALVALRRPDAEADVPPCAIVGSVEMFAKQPQWDTLEPRAPFKTLYCNYMRGHRSAQPQVLEARVEPGDYVYVIDGRVREPSGDVPFHDIVGWYRSDDQGRPIAASFEYNDDHRLVAHGQSSSLLTSDVLRELAYREPAEAT